MTLFGEDDGDRCARLAKAEREAALAEDETRHGGQQENTLLAIQREARQRRRPGDDDGGGAGGDAAAAAAAKGSGKGGGGGGKEAGKAGDEAAPGPKAPAADGDAKNKGGAAAAAAGGGGGAAGGGGADGAGPSGGNGGGGGGADDLAAAFAAAAAQLAERRAEEALCVEDRIAKYLRAWCKEWGDDLEARSDEAKASGAGHQATMVYKQSMRFLEPLWRALEARSLEDELRVGLWMMVQHMRDRNYLAANDVYLKLAIGNSPWPIGVTSVGIHERSAREKISHVMNASGRAHIMNDEATRKYFQAVKRLMSNLQRLRPTDPSRSADFNLTGGEGRGAAGGGSEKRALLEAAAAGKLPALAAPAPHFMAPDGSVAIPRRWEAVLAEERRRAGLGDGGAGSGGSGDEGGGGGGRR